MVLLIVSDSTQMAQSASTKILYGMARHRTIAFVWLAEAAVNLILSIVLLRRYGVIGVAIGTCIPQLCTNLLFLPEHLCRVLGIRLRTFVRETYLAPALLCAPLIGTLLLTRHLFVAHTYLELGVQLAAGGAVYGVGLLWFLLTKEQMGLELRKFIRFRPPMMESTEVAPGIQG
jgi:O-antigen/teichoic acid export membrane protein